MSILEKLGRYRDAGLLLIRTGLGLSLSLIHGLPKITGGVETWTKIGGAMQHLGIHSMPAFWGFMASASEFIGGVLVILGLFFRPACLFIAFTMFVAATMHLSRGDGFGTASHAIELAVVFVGLLLVGPGKYSFSK